MERNVAFLEALHDGCLIVDQSWHIIASNRPSLLLLRHTGVPLNGQLLWDVLPSAGTGVRELLEQAMAGRTSVEQDVFYPSLYVWHELRAVPVEDGLALLLRDITDRQWVLRREAERAYLQTMFMQAPIGLAVLRGPWHQFEFINRLGQQMIGGRMVEGRTVREVFPELEAQGILAVLDHVYRTGEPYHAAEQMIELDRYGTGQTEVAYFALSYQPLRGFDAQISGVLNLSIEVTNQVVLRQASSREGPAV